MTVTYVGTVGSVRFDEKDTKQVLTVSAAVNHRDSDATWIQTKIWGRRGAAIREHVKKGEDVFVSGRLEVQKRENDNGSVFELVCHADQFEFLGRREKRRTESEPDPE